MNKGGFGFKKNDKNGVSNYFRGKLWKDAIKRAALVRDGNALRSLSEVLIDKASMGS